MVLKIIRNEEFKLMFLNGAFLYPFYLSVVVDNFFRSTFGTAPILKVKKVLTGLKKIVTGALVRIPLSSIIVLPLP